MLTRPKTCSQRCATSLLAGVVLSPITPSGCVSPSPGPIRNGVWMISLHLTIFKTGGRASWQLVRYCSPSVSVWKEAQTSFKFILLTSFPATDKSCDFQGDIIKFDHLQHGKRILTAWNITVRYCWIWKMWCYTLDKRICVPCLTADLRKGNKKSQPS